MELDQIEKLLAGVVEVLANGVAHIAALFLHHAGDEVLDHGQTAATTRTRLAALLDAINAFRTTTNGIANGVLGDRFAGADEGVVGQGHDAGAGGFTTAGAEDEVFGRFG